MYFQQSSIIFTTASASDWARNEKEMEIHPSILINAVSKKPFFSYFERNARREKNKTPWMPHIPPSTLDRKSATGRCAAFDLTSSRPKLPSPPFANAIIRILPFSWVFIIIIYSDWWTLEPRDVTLVFCIVPSELDPHNSVVRFGC